MSKPLKNMKLKHTDKGASPTNVMETTFPLLNHAAGCNKARDKWEYTFDATTGNVILSCPQCVQTYTYELNAVEYEAKK